MVCCAFIHSHLTFGVGVYANTTTVHLSKLITLNNKLLHILQYKPGKTQSTELYNATRLLHKYQILLFMHIHRVKKNDNDVAHYNFNAHEPILVIFFAEMLLSEYAIK